MLGTRFDETENVRVLVGSRDDEGRSSASMLSLPTAEEA
jgi:hypothetical protein